MCWRLCGLPPATTWPSYRAYVLFCTVWVLWAHLVVARPCGWQGGGTSVVGALEPTRGPRYKGFLSLDLRHMAKLVSVDKTSMVAEVEAGMLGPALEDALRAHDLTWVAMLRSCVCFPARHVGLTWCRLVVARLRFFPQSFEFSSVGGWVATRAGGETLGAMPRL